MAAVLSILAITSQQIQPDASARRQTLQQSLEAHCHTNVTSKVSLDLTAQ